MNVSSSLHTPRAIDRDRLDVVRTLSPVVRAIGLRQVARWTALGFAVGAAIGTVFMLIAHLHPFDYAIPGAIGLAVLGLVAGAAAGLTRWPQAMDAARAADLHFGLEDRLTTALELREVQTPVAALQSRDLERRIDGVDLAGYRSHWLGRKETAFLGVAALAFALALAFGVPHSTSHAAATSDVSTARARHAAAKQVQKLASQLHLGLTPAQLQSPAMRKLNAALTRLRHQLLRTSSPRSSLRAISLTQQQLRRVAQSLHPVNAKAVAQLNSSLSHYLNGTNTGKGQKSATARSNPATARALNALAQSLSHLSAARRAALASALARAANATQDNTLRQELRRAASSLANGQTQSARSALQQAAQQLAQSSTEQSAQARLGSAQAQLNSLKSRLASQMAGSSPLSFSAPGAKGQGKSNSGATLPGTGQGQQPQAGKGSRSGQGNQPGKGKGSGQGQGSARGQGTIPGQGTGKGKGSGTGRGTGTGKGTGRGQGQRAGSTGRSGVAGGHGAGGRGSTSRTHSGKSVTVYVPGPQGKGPTIDRTGPNGEPATGAIVPYQQVIAQYAQSAHQALDRTSLPPSLQGYVRRYFSTLSR